MTSTEHHPPLPPHCFTQQELEQFLSLSGSTLKEVNYYTVLTSRLEYLYALELIFDGEHMLLLASDEDEPAIRVYSAEELVETAKQMMDRGDQMNRRPANGSTLWQPVLNEKLENVLLSKNEDGLSLNDALVLDFGTSRLIVSMGRMAGLAVGAY